MKRMVRSKHAGWLLLPLLVVPAAQATEVLANGGFEADAAIVQSPDALTAWVAAEDGIVGGVAILSGTVTPASGSATVGAASGVNYAVLDLAAPSAMALSQTFAVGAQPVSNAVLSFDWFATYSGAETAFIHGPQGLDYTGFDPVLTLRIDVLKSGAPGLGTDASDLVFTDYLNTSRASGVQAYSAFSGAIGGLLAGETYTLRIAAAANTGLLTVGLDNVSLNVSSVPEPSSWALGLTGLAAIGFAARRRA